MSNSSEDSARRGKPAGSAERAVLAFIALFGLVAAFLFLPAGRLDWVAGWVWLGTMFTGLLVMRRYVVRAHPGLPERRRRAGAGTPGWDHAVLGVFRAAVTAALVLAALDAGRYGWSSLPVFASVFGIVLIGVGLTLFGMAMVHNPFFESTVRIQTDQQHRVAISGPYRTVRHPGYAGLMLVVLGSVLVLGSAWAIIAVGVAWASLIVRTALEDRFLQRELAGYGEYAATVRFRLVPGIW